MINLKILENFELSKSENKFYARRTKSEVILCTVVRSPVPHEPVCLIIVFSYCQKHPYWRQFLAWISCKLDYRFLYQSSANSIYKSKRRPYFVIFAELSPLLCRNGLETTPPFAPYIFRGQSEQHTGLIFGLFRLGLSFWRSKFEVRKGSKNGEGVLVVHTAELMPRPRATLNLNVLISF